MNCRLCEALIPIDRAGFISENNFEELCLGCASQTVRKKKIIYLDEDAHCGLFCDSVSNGPPELSENEKDFEDGE